MSLFAQEWLGGVRKCMFSLSFDVPDTVTALTRLPVPLPIIAWLSLLLPLPPYSLFWSQQPEWSVSNTSQIASFYCSKFQFTVSFRVIRSPSPNNGPLSVVLMLTRNEQNLGKLNKGKAMPAASKTNCTNYWSCYLFLKVPQVNLFLC